MPASRIALFAPVLLAGCSIPNVTAPRAMVTAPVTQRALAATAPASRPASLPPLLLHLPGIGGKRSIDQSMVRGFVQGGFTGDVEIYDWTGGDIGITALRATDRNRQQAHLIADKLLARYRADPNAPIYLTCHSGGAGLAVWALEDLPPDVHVQTLVFMSPALSPTYDLTDALQHVVGHAYVFTSLLDTVVLGYGTRVFGTIDGIKTDAAGRVGFTRPATGDVRQYAKLISFPYNDSWIRYYDYGDHVGGMNRVFSKNILVPLVLFGVLPPMPPPATARSADPSPLPSPVPTTLPHMGRGAK